jgi:spore germination cell wall hydrolase CwlJ-like protein
MIMTMIKKVLLGSILILSMFVAVNHVSVGADGKLIQAQKELEEQRVIAQLQREERWMKQLDCLARNVYYEARGESYEGQLAVALVTLNRVEHGLFPNSICGVVNERKLKKGFEVCQFSWRCESHTNPKKRVHQKHESYKAAMEAIFEYESLTSGVITKDVLYFHAKYVKPSWRKHKQLLAKIDNHIFYTNKPGDTRR